MAVVKTLETIAARVLVEFVHEQIKYLPNQVVDLPGELAKMFKDFGWIDDHPTAVAQSSKPEA